MDLQELKFVINTDDVKKAVGDLQQLSTAVEKLNKPIQDLEKKSEQVAQAQQKSAKASKEAAKATEEVKTKADPLEKLLNRLGTLYTDLAQGSTKWESSILTTARNLGASGSQLKPFMDMLEKIRGLSKDPFDSAIGSVRSITQELDALTNRSKLAEQGIFLTNKQLSEYSRIANEIKGKISAGGLDPNSGQGLEEFNRKLQDQQHLYLVNAQAVNAQKEAEKLRNKEAKAALQAQAAAQKELEKAERQVQAYRMKNWADSVGQRNAELDAMRNYYVELEKSAKQAAIAEEKANRERLVASYAQQGVSKGVASTAATMQVRGVPQEAIDSYIREAKAKDEAARAARSLAAANKYITEVDQRLAAALDETNAGLNKRATDALVKYQNALKATGMSAEQVAAKMAVAKEKFEAIGSKEQAQRLEYLSRAISVQMGDVAISLASGMNPLLVMIQQGDQIRGAIQQAGASGKQLEKAMSTAAIQIATSFRDTGKAIGGFLIGAIQSSGKAFNDFAMSVTGLDGVLGKLSKTMNDNATSGGLLSRAFSVVARAASLLTGGVLAGLGAAIVGVGVAMYQNWKQQKELSIALATTGGALQMNKDQAVSYALALEKTGGSAVKYLDAITAMAKAGYTAKENNDLVIKSALDMQKYAGTALDDTIKKFKDLAEKPFEGLVQLAAATGKVNPEVIALVASLERQGRVTEAAAIATKEMAKVNNMVVQQIANDAGYLERAWRTVIDSLKSLWSSFRSTVMGWGAKDPLDVQLKNAEERLANLKKGDMRSSNRQAFIAQEEARIENLKEQMKLLAMTNTLESQRATRAEGEGVWQEYKNKVLSDEQKIQAELLKIRESGIKAGKTEAEILKLQAEYREKFTKKEEKKGSGFRNLTDNTLQTEQKVFDSEMRRLEALNKDKLAINKLYYELGLKDRSSYLEEEERLIRESETKRLEELDRFNNRTQELEAQSILALAKEYQRANIARPDLKDENLSNYTKAVENVQRAFAALRETLGDTRERIVSVADARSIAALDILKGVVQSTTKIYDDFIKGQDDLIAKRKEEVDLAEKLKDVSGAEAARIKATTEAYKGMIPTVSNLAKMAEEAQQAMIDIEFNPDATSAQIVAARKVAEDAMLKAAQARIKQTTYAEQAGIDAAIAYYKQKWDEAKAEITGTLVDALMAGGSRGADIIRNKLREQLRKPLTIVIDAIVNNIGGDFMKNFMGGSPGGSLGTNASGAMSTLGNVGSFFSALNNSVSNGIATSFGKLATSSFGQKLGLSSVDPASGITGLTNTGSMLSKGLQIGGNVVAGYGLSKAIGNGYKTGLGDLVDIAGTIASAFFGPIGGVVSGLVNRAFGTKLKDVGIQGTFGGDQGFAGNTFQFMKGGWFRSDKTKLGTLDSGIQRSLGEQFNAFRTQIATLATSVGQQADALVNYTQDIKISTMGLSEEQIQQKLADEFKKVQEGMAKLIITTDEYSVGNETALETLTRLSSALTTTNAAFDLLGFKLFDVSLAGADAAQALADAFGGLESMQTILAYYYENFFSDNERLAVSTRQMTKAFADLGYELPASKKAFRELVDTVKASGNNAQLAAILNLSKGFNELDKAMASISDSTGALSEALKDASTSVVEEIKRLRGTAAQGGNLASLESQFAILTAQARAGDTSALNKLPEFTQAIEEAVKLTATSSMDIAFTRARLATSLTDTLSALGLSVPAFATGGDHAGGLRIVGENGPELEATGPSRIFNAGQTAAILSGNSGNETLLNTLIGEVQLLRAEVRADVAANSKTSRILDRVVQDGETVSISGTIDGGVV